MTTTVGDDTHVSAAGLPAGADYLPPAELPDEAEAPTVRRSDPQALFGCRCDRCDLQDRDPVLPELRLGARLTVIAEAPGKDEEREGRPLVGASGKELMRAVQAAGFARTDLSLDNVLLCRIKAKSFDVYLRRLARRNAKRVLDGQEPFLPPVEACAPHLDRTLAQARGLLVLGKTALGALTGARTGEEALGKTRGFPLQVRGLPTVAAFHAAHVLRNRRWTEVFRSDVSKAFRCAAGSLRWTAPQVLFNPTLSQLDGALEAFAKERHVACDTETEPGPGRETFDPEYDRLRCVAFGTAKLGLALGFRSVPKQPVPTTWNVPPEVARERVRNFFVRRSSGQAPFLIGHNLNVYDRPILARERMPLPDYAVTLDTLPLSRNAWSELPHDLDFLMSWYTDAPKHKGRADTGEKVDHDAWESDAELHRYCAADCGANWTIFAPLLQKVRETDQGRVYQSDLQMQRFAVGAHRAGMRIDEAERQRHERRLLATMTEANDRAQVAVKESGLWTPGKGAATLNLASVPQVREFLYDDLALPWQGDDPEDEDPTTKRDAMYELLTLAGLPGYARRFIDALLDYRSAFRALSKDVRGLEINPLTGRVHSGWGALGVTGRPQSSDPNVSNIPATKRDPDSLRSMYVAAPGCALVYCDLEQVELRTVALLAGDEPWLDLFARQERGETYQGHKIDLHRFNAGAFFDRLDWWLIDALEREFGKNLTYLFLYGGGARRAMLNMRQVLKALPDGSRFRPYATFTIGTAADGRPGSRALREKLLRAHPALPRWWHETVEDWREHRFLREPGLGRVRYFLDGEGGEGRTEAEEQRSELINFRVQCIPGFVRVLTNRGYIPIKELVGQKFMAWTGKKWASAVAVEKGVAELHRLSLDRGVALMCSADHRVLKVLRGNHTWTAAEDIEGQRRIVLDLARPLEFGRPADQESAYHLGLWLADGTASLHVDDARGWANVAWAVGPTNKDGRGGEMAVRRLCRWLRAFGLPAYRHSTATVTSVSTSKDGELWLRAWGAHSGWRAHTKRIPELIWRSDLEGRKAFLRGFLDGDGYLQEYKKGSSTGTRVRIRLCQRRLLEELWLLFRTVGVDGRVAGPALADRHGHKCYWLDLSAALVFAALEWGKAAKLRTATLAPWWAVDHFADLHPTCRADEVIKNRLRLHRTPTNPYVLARMGFPNGYDYASVRSVGLPRARLPVFTLTVADSDHAYVAEGVVSKNSRVASHMGGAGAVGRVMREIGWPWEGALRGLGGAGLVHHGYDSLMVEVAEAEVERAKAILQAAMTTRFEWHGRSVAIPAAAKAGRRWSELA